jgi:hypothetical protein
MGLIPTSSDRISRWTPTIFACALGNFMLAQLLLVAGASWPAAPSAAGGTLATVHLLTIGWITLLMLGALFQFVPVLAGQKLLSRHLSVGALVLIELGLAGMVGGFFLIGTRFRLLLPAGGTGVVVGIMVGILDIAVPLARKHPLPLSGRFVIAGLALLLLTVALGLSFALAFTVPAFIGMLGGMLGPILARGIEYHILAGIGGWFTLTAIGVSYELLPMFMLAPHERGAWGVSVLWLGSAGFVLALASGLAAPGPLSFFPSSAEPLGRTCIGIAVLLYLIDVVRMYRDRRRRRIELHNRAAIGAFASLAIALVVATASSVVHDLGRSAPTLIFLLIFGWLGGLGLAQLYKIVPFLAWLSHFGPRLGTGPVPRVQDLVNERFAAYLFAAYFAAVAIASGAAFAGFPMLVRAAVALLLTATVLLGREYWRAWQGYYTRRKPPCTSMFLSQKQKEAGRDHAQATHA